jgi:hypothetical protein
LSTLNLLIEAMQEVIELDKKLYMKMYYRNGLEKGTTIHDCGTPACILGYAALKVPDTPEELWCQLREELGRYLADSIVGYSPSYREGSLKRVDPEHPLLGHNHITSLHPTAQDALDFIKKVTK